MVRYTEQRKAHKFVTIGELQRRLMRAQQEAEEEIAAKLASDRKMAAEQMAKAEAQRIAAEVAKIDAATAAAASKKTTLINTFSKLRGTWAVRVKQQLEEVDGLVEAVKKLQRARRMQVSSESGEHQAVSSAGCVAPQTVVNNGS